MKKYLSLMLALSLVLGLLAGLGSAAAEGETITFTLGEHVANVKEQNPWVYAVMEAYMAQNPNVKIELTEAPAEEHVRNMKMAAQSNTLPELFWMQQGAAIEMAEAGYLADLTADLTADAEFVDGFLPNVLDSLKIEGKIYGVPCELQSNGFWLNKALFDQYGLELPVTFDDMLAYAAVVQENGIIPLAQGAKDIFTAWAFENMH